MKFVNLTPHAINVILDSETRTFPPDGTVARVSAKTIQCDPLDGIPRVHQAFGDVEGLPGPSPGVVFIVSALVLGRPELQGRIDLVAPDTSPAGAVRDPEGKIIGVKGFVT